jgi:hypothetical protein
MARTWQPLQHFSPLVVIKLLQFELQIGKGRFVELRLLDRAELVLFAVIPTGVARQQGFTASDL